jgi:hypothetical protein
VLESLAPDRPLNLWFRQIIEEGTENSFRPEDNADWTRVTRPILEAFFHARFFLDGRPLRDAHRVSEPHCRAGMPHSCTCTAALTARPRARAS